jgi:membrane-bound metal-dependent hydrolase YbcI (DUF457 family)
VQKKHIFLLYFFLTPEVPEDLPKLTNLLFINPSHTGEQMYFFFHLLTGIILGLLAGEITKDRRWVIPFAFGAVVPDLIDKPIGLLVLAGSIDYGRIFSHTLLVFIILMGIGLIYRKRTRNPVFEALALGILSHQVLDVMWFEPSNWLYPFLGPFRSFVSPEPFMSALLRDLLNPAEIITVILIICITILYMKQDKFLPVLKRNHKPVRYSLMAGIVFFSILSFVILSVVIWGRMFSHRGIPALAWSTPVEFFIGSLISASLAYLLFRWLKKFPKEDLPA